MKHFLSTLLVLTLLLPCLCGQSPRREAELGFKRSRGEPAGATRLHALKTLARLKLEGNVATFLAALEANARAVSKSEKKLARLDRRHRELHRLLTEQKNSPAKLERLTRGRAEARGDIHFHQLQIRKVDEENAALRAGIAATVHAQAGEVQTALVEAVVAALRGSRAYPLRGQIIRLAGQVARPQTVAILGELLSGSKNPRERADLAEALGSSGLTEAELPLIGALGDPFQVVRMTVIRGLVRVGGAAAVTALIEAVPREKGRLLEDVILALRHLTGVSFHTNIHLWRDWWKNARRGYQRPGKHGKVVREGTELANQARKKRNQNSFYGVQTRSHALVFLIDKSGSMNEPATRAGVTHSGRRGETKLDRAKRELIRVVRGLPSKVSINLIAYGDELEPYSRNMLILDDRSRMGIVAWVKSLRASGRTNMFDALEMVFNEARGKGQRVTKEMVVDTIFLLSDGLPTAGKIKEADALAAEVERLNAVTRIVIHTIGIGRNHAKSLLQRLSRSSQGLYIPAR